MVGTSPCLFFFFTMTSAAAASGRGAKAKKAKTDRRAARVGFDRSKKVKLSNSGSGVEMTKVVRFKYQKGFTQAVRAPCQLEDLL